MKPQNPQYREHATAIIKKSRFAAEPPPLSAPSSRDEP
jgi:hypothetical protein